MGHVDRWVIHHVLQDFGARLKAVPGLTVAVNLSANSLGEPFLLPFLHAELSASVLPAHRIQLEITETALINNMTAATRLVTEMRRAGCTVSLDDFGAGLSSFAYLKQFPVDYLKIDGSFIRHLTGSAVDREIVSSINDIGHRLGVLTVAESVEDEETMRTLRTIGVDYAQGYVIGRPMPLEAFLDKCRAILAAQEAEDASDIREIRRLNGVDDATDIGHLADPVHIVDIAEALPSDDVADASAEASPDAGVSRAAPRLPGAKAGDD
jgi:EAL domain-containing protein (putative c-di-GMP-specific phosphodiesterase class I)